MNDQADIIARREGTTGRLTLNRPKALHALTTGMCQAMIDALLEWRDDPAIHQVILDHAGERGFCAGGDIRMVAESGKGDGRDARAFFFTEYRLNHLLFTYPKPIAAFMDGIVMGGGVGISLPARFRVATERTTFAMPESGIGLFPDVGAGWYLPRLGGAVGRWLAMTGARLKTADCVALDLATHFIASARLEAVKSAIIAGTPPEDALAAAATDPGPAPITERRADIDRLFSGDSVEAIFAALQADGSDWATQQLDLLGTKSPQTLKVAHRQLHLGARMPSFADEMAMEYRIAARICTRHDFIEGVRAVIIDKDNAPRWAPPDLVGVTDAMLDGIFAPLPPGEEWTPLPEAAP